MNQKEKKLYKLALEQLSDEMISDVYRGRVNSPYCGHCHHATIALYNLLGGKQAGYRVRKAIDEIEIKHYWIESKTGEIIDPTREQYTDLGRKLPYSKKISRGVSYRTSNAAEQIIENVLQILKKG